MSSGSNTPGNKPCGQKYWLISVAALAMNNTLARTNGGAFARGCSQADRPVRHDQGGVREPHNEEDPLESVPS
jgi:hypothetical protein